MDRRVIQVVTGHQQREGGGFVVRRPFPSRGIPNFDPFLMLDELGPVDYAPGEAMGAPDHPHRGFETVSYILEGEVAHADSAGHSGFLHAGDVQWMTAGAGVVHREMPSLHMQKEGGPMHGFQLWVNLPRALKRSPPRYQELRADRIPEATTADGLASVRVIAGSALGVQAPTRTHTPIQYHHWRLRAGATLSLSYPSDQRIGIYVFRGQAQLCGTALKAGQLGVLGEGEKFLIEANENTEFLLLGGTPLREPVAWSGPFVMNTEAELHEAYADFRAGRMGAIPPEIVRA
ncbi:MAG TPA: pirin family protein [Myxococcota bacterium]|nr:pirin family protein [Myxococcota bacterium]